MPHIRWSRPVDGAFATRADWHGHAVPGSADAAVLDAAGPAFTVTAARSVRVKSLRMSANAALVVSGTKAQPTVFKARAGSGTGVEAGTITIGDFARFAVGGNLDNTGTIALASTFNEPPHDGAATLVIKRDTTLTGGGTVTLSGRMGDVIGGRGTTLVNVDNTISGAGEIGAPSGYSGRPGLNLVNEAAGVIDATCRGGLQIAGGLVGGGSLVNDGLIEDTGGSLVIADMRITGEGTIAIAGPHLFAQLSGCTLAGQTLIVAAGSGLSVVNTGGDIASLTVGKAGAAGFGVGGGAVTVTGDLANDGTISSDADLTVDGAVRGSGKLIIYAGTADFAGAFDQDVVFAESGERPAPVLELARSRAYGGQVSNFAAGDTFDLRDIGFESAGEATYSGTAASGVLTVTDGTHTARITLVGDYIGQTFTADDDGQGGVTVSLAAGDAQRPPAAPSPHLFAAAAAGLGATAGLAREPPPAHAEAWRAPIAAPRMQEA